MLGLKRKCCHRIPVVFMWRKKSHLMHTQQHWQLYKKTKILRGAWSVLSTSSKRGLHDNRGRFRETSFRTLKLLETAQHCLFKVSDSSHLSNGGLDQLEIRV